MKTIEFTAPSAWAGYLINGDASGLDEAEKLAADAFIEWVDQGDAVSCEDYGFCATPGSYAVYPFAADCQLYTFHDRSDARLMLMGSN